MELQTLYLDLDGVLADFDARALELCGSLPKDGLPVRTLWRTLARQDDFFGSLDFMEGAMDLWERCKPFNPVILTGLPRGNWAEPQKRAWVAAKLGEDVEVITCMSRDKKNWSGPGCLLIDDRESYREPWEAEGGTFIHYQNAEQVLRELDALGL